MQRLSTATVTVVALFALSILDPVAALGGGTYVHDGALTYCWRIAQPSEKTFLDPDTDRVSGYRGVDCPLEMTIALDATEVETQETVGVRWTVKWRSNTRNRVNMGENFGLYWSPEGKLAQIVHSNAHSCVFGSGCDPFEDGEELEDKTVNKPANFSSSMTAEWDDVLRFRKAGTYSVLGHIIIPDEENVDGSRFDYVVYTTLTVIASKNASTKSTKKTILIGAVGGGIFVLLIVAGIVCIRRRRHRSPLGEDTRGGSGCQRSVTYAEMYSNESALNATSSLSTYPTNKSGERHSGESISVWKDPELLRLQVNSDDIVDERKLGNGAYGVVWLARFRQKRWVASKRLKREDATPLLMNAFVEEIKLMAKLDHPHIVKLVGVAWTNGSDIQALLEFMENGDLRSYLDAPSEGPVTWTPEKLQIAVDMAEALVYVHSFQPPLIHRDLKSRNVLLSAEMRAQLSDFGVSRYQSDAQTMTNGVGTGRWLAPEIISGRTDYGPASDIFALGVVLSEMDTHRVPYSDVRGPSGNRMAEVAILQLVASGQLSPTFSENCPTAIRAIAQQCLALDPDARPTAPQIAYALRTEMLERVGTQYIL